MYCPNCKGEFREGFVRCNICDVDLIPALPPEPPRDLADLVPLLTTSDVPYLMVVKSLLASEDIEFLVHGEESLGLVTILPSGGSAPAALSATVFVRQTNLSRAREIVTADRSGES